MTRSFHRRSLDKEEGMRCAGKRLLTISVTVALTLAPAATAFAQSTGTINGRVIDQAEAVLPGVTVTITNVNTGLVREAVSNAEGLYSVPGLEPGTYKVSAAMPGFATMTRDGIALQ